MIIAVPTPKAGNLDEFFQHKSIQDSLQLGMATPMPVLQPSGKPGVALCFHETTDYIRALNRPKFGIKYGRFVVNDVEIFKLMLLIVLDEAGTKCSVAEMNINWHDLVAGRVVITALAAGGPLFLRCYGDQWTCEKLVRLPADPGLESFARTFIGAVEDAEPWSAVDFGHASAFIDSRFTLNELMRAELPKQMAIFATSGELCGDEAFDASATEESSEQMHSRHSEFLNHHCQPLAAFGWEGFEKGGRGAVVVQQTGMGCKIQYVTLAEAGRNKTYKSMVGLIKKYDPAASFVVAIDDSADFCPAYVIALPDLTPKMAFEQGLQRCLQV
jgi:hypothetical protein